MEQLAISFIIPALNEEYFLPCAIKSIRQHAPGSMTYEIIVADNGSTDESVTIARSLGAKVLVDETATVAGLRNHAAAQAKGSMLVFLDADIELTNSWGKNISAVFRALHDDPWQVTGSRCGVPPSTGWIGKYWFRPLVMKPGKYVNSGHLITSRQLFSQIGGFDETLETGEDYRFGIAASKINAKITNNPLLAVIHKGYPETPGEFIKREIWHGRGDCKSVQTIISSKVALISILFFGLHILFFVSLAILQNIFVAMTSLLLIFAICFLSAYVKYDARSIRSLVAAGFLYYLYYISRLLSCLPNVITGTRKISSGR